MTDWKVKQWTRGKTKIFTIDDSDGTNVNISGYTLILSAWRGDTTLFSGACTIVSGTIGGCLYTLKSGDVSTTGPYSFEIEMAISGVVKYTDTYTLQVQEVSPR